MGGWGQRWRQEWNGRRPAAPSVHGGRSTLPPSVPAPSQLTKPLAAAHRSAHSTTPHIHIHMAPPVLLRARKVGRKGERGK